MSFTVGSVAAVKAPDLVNLTPRTEDPTTMASEAMGMTWEDGQSLRTNQSEPENKPDHDPGEIQGTWLNWGRLVWMNRASPAAIDPYRGTENPGGARDTREAALLAQKGTSRGEIALTGETFDSPVTPNWSHDGTRIAYSATDSSDNGHPSKSNPAVGSDIHIVPFNGGAGGTVTAVAGPSDPSAKEYYPAFSQDDRFIAFSRAASGAPYYNTSSEIYVVDSNGGTPIHLRAKDPVACTGEVSPGINNSWAKWSPHVAESGDRT